MRPMLVAFLLVFGCAHNTPGGRQTAAAAADTKKHDPVAVAFVIDRSGSMMVGAKLDAAKRGVRDAIAILGETDKIAIIAYDLEADVVVQLEDAKANAARDQKLAEVKASGGTDFRPALEAARAQLVGATAKRKLIVFLTDGESPFDSVEELAKTMTAAKIMISTIGLPDASYDELLRQIADKTGGRFHKLAGAGDLANTIVEEAQYLVDGK